MNVSAETSAGRAPAAAVILAAGAASRMGKLKTLLPLGNRPLLSLVIDSAAAAHCRPIIVVIGPEAERVRQQVPLPDGGRFVENPEYEQGMATSLAAGIGALQTHDPLPEAAVLLLGDQPLVEAQHIQTVKARLEQARLPPLTGYDGDGRSGTASRSGPVAAPAAVAARAVWRGQPGHPVVVHRTLFPLLMKLSGDRGAREILSRPATEVISVPFADDAVTADIDTWDDYLALCRRLGAAPAAGP